MVKVLVLCTGNSVRSQMAEGYFNFYAQQHAMFFSAGINKTEVNPYAIKVMAEDNIDLSEHLSKSLEAFSNINFDYVLTVCDPPNEDYKTKLNALEWHHAPVPDPSSKGKNEEKTLKNFREVRDQIKKMVLKFIGQELLSNEKEVLLS